MFRALFATEKNEIERSIVQITEGLFVQVMGPGAMRMGRRLGRDLLRQAKADARALYSGVDIYAENLGDELMHIIGSDALLDKHVAATARHGVTLEDHRRWNNTSPVERSAMLLQDELIMVSTFKLLVESGIPHAEAADRIRKTSALYTTDSDSLADSDPDSPLPVELKLRVNDFRDQIIAYRPDEYEQELLTAPSFNAWVRQNITQGKL